MSAGRAAILASVLILASLAGCARTPGRIPPASGAGRTIRAPAEARGADAAGIPAGAPERRMARIRTPRTLGPAPAAEIAWPENLMSLSPHAHLLALPARPRMLPPPRPAAASGAESGGPSGDPAGAASPRVRRPFSREEWRAIAAEAEEIFGVDANLVLAVIRAESDFDVTAVSHAGAEGAMQIMPATGRALGLVDPFDPRANVYAGTRYLMDQLRRFGSPELALAAYNAGPGAVLKHGGIPPYAETREYVRRVMTYWRETR